MVKMANRSIHQSSFRLDRWYRKFEAFLETSSFFPVVWRGITPERETTTNANNFICNQSVKNGIEQQYNKYLQLLPSLLDILVFSTSLVVSSSIAAKSSSFIIQSPYTPTKLVYITAYSLLGLLQLLLCASLLAHPMRPFCLIGQKEKNYQ